MIDGATLPRERAGRSEEACSEKADPSGSSRRLILVSNRGPVEHVVAPGGRLRARKASGGVATALAALGREVELTWIAAAMTEGDRRVAIDPELAPPDALPRGLSLRLLALPEEVYRRYYGVIANRLLWFVQHSMFDLVYGVGVDRATRRAWDEGYVVANRVFARALRDEVARSDEPPVVLVQDYHLYLVADLARALGVQATFQQFVHIPWPAPEYWAFLPADVRRSICAGLIANDVVGFQTPTSANNFLATCAAFLDDARVDASAGTVRRGEHVCRVRAYPISIDVADLERLAASRTVQRYREALARRSAGQTIVRVDRLDPSKNVVRGFEAYATLLERHPELQGKVTFFAFLVPSRERLPEYRRYRQAVKEAIERVEARFARPGWRPIEVFYENNYPQAIAGMSLADVLLVNPLADGMNLIAKEGPIVNQRNGVLILSEGAGAHGQLRAGALSVAPGDVEGTAEALHQALTMTENARIARRRILRQAIESQDLAWWIRSQLDDLTAPSVQAGAAIPSAGQSAGQPPAEVPLARAAAVARAR